MTGNRYNNRFFGDWLLRVVLVVSPLALPGLYLNSNYNSAGKLRRETEYNGFLALPIPPSGEVDWISSWACVEPLKVNQIPKGMDDAPAMDSMPLNEVVIKESTSVSFFGYIEEDDTRTYCLFDEKDQRWFRLPVGEVDAASQLKAEWNAEDGVACLLNLKTGVRYRVKSGETELELVAFD